MGTRETTSEDVYSHTHIAFRRYLMDGGLLRLLLQPADPQSSHVLDLAQFGCERIKNSGHYNAMLQAT